MQAWLQLVSALHNFTQQHHTAGFLIVHNVSADGRWWTETPTIEDDPCLFEKHEWLMEKLILISIVGTVIAVLGIIGNVTTAVVLTRPAMRTPNNLYLTFLAVFDTLLLISAIVLYSVEYIYEYTDSVFLYSLWLRYVRFAFALSHMAQTGSVYITVAVTFERLLAVLYPKRAKRLCTHDRASLVILIVVVFAVLFNSTKYFEMEVIDVENCTGFAAQHLLPSSLLKNSIYTTVHSLWLTQFIMVFLPFIVLFAVNTAIAYRVRRSLKKLSWIQRGKKRDKLKERSKDATRVLIVIVVVFLLCNALGFVVTLLENMYGQDGLKKCCYQFYAFAREAINFLAILNSSINFVIYMIFGQDFRRELVSVWGCKIFICMLPVGDLFTAENLMADGEYQRRPAIFATQSGLLKRRGAAEFPRKESVKCKKTEEKRKPAKMSNIKGILAAAQPVPISNSNGISRNHQRTVIVTSITNCDEDEDENENRGPPRVTITTVNTGERKDRCTANGAVDPRYLAPCAGSMPRKGSRGSSRSDFAVTTRKRGSASCETRRRCSSDSPSRDSNNGKLGGSNAPSADTEPLAPFLLGMLISTAPTVRQAGMEATIKRYESENEDLNWV